MAEIGIVSKANVSAYDRSRVHQSTLYAAEKRPLTMNINGAAAKGLKIVQAVFQTYNNPQVIMSDASIAADQRSAGIWIEAQVGGIAIIRGTAFMDDGSKIPQNFRINVNYAPVYAGTVWTTGPSTLTVVWP